MICSECGKKVRGRPTASGICRACRLQAQEAAQELRDAVAEKAQELEGEGEPAGEAAAP